MYKLSMSSSLLDKRWQCGIANVVERTKEVLRQILVQILREIFSIKRYARACP
jgi:hypothetical protein